MFWFLYGIFVRTMPYRKLCTNTNCPSGWEITTSLYWFLGFTGSPILNSFSPVGWLQTLLRLYLSYNHIMLAKSEVKRLFTMQRGFFLFVCFFPLGWKVKNRNYNLEMILTFAGHYDKLILRLWIAFCNMIPNVLQGVFAVQCRNVSQG